MKKVTKNLAGVERSIQIFSKRNHELLKETNIDISLEELLKIIIPKKDDPFLNDFYKLDEQQVNRILSYVSDFPKSDFNTCYYVIACFGIYNTSIPSSSALFRVR